MNDEAALLAAIRADPGADTPRLVYADWLDDHGRPGGAFLRAECALAAVPADDPRRARLLAAVQEAGIGRDAAWVATVSRVAIESCGVTFRFRCTKRWELLQRTDDPCVRFCGQCRQEVTFCRTIAEAQAHAALGDCIAVDPRLVRRPDDLASDMWGLEGMVAGIALPAEDEIDLKGEEPPEPRRGGRR
ncbi:TIGR02996 domain-containing protein [bacterium]|nr:TIGR02996 domain-containing protein [bacterium]